VQPKVVQNQPSAAPIYTFSQKQKPVKVSQPIGALKTNNLSIKEMLNPEKSENGLAEEQEIKEREPLNLDALNMHWRKYAHLLKEQDKSNLFSVMTKRDPRIINDNAFVFEVDNKIMGDLFKTELNNLMLYLRQNLKNGALQITTTMNEQNEETANPYSPKEKFKVLADKNPNLLTFQKLFNLDLDY
jgi:hypothetical protein